jgi:CubicO group peptidase (beta-lactamase class C family)
MDNQNIKSILNPTLATIRDNKAKWNLPEFRRRGYRDLHKINRYGLLFRSDAVLTLDIDINEEIGKIPSVQKMTNHDSFCSLIVGKGQNILFEKYANDFSEIQPQTIMSITKLFVNLCIGEMIDNNLLDLNKKISFYLPEIGSGYAEASVQDVLNMNVINAYTEDYTDPYSSSFLHESVGGWRLPENLDQNENQEEFLNKIKAKDGIGLENKSDLAFYKSANTDVLGLIIEKISGIKLRDWILSITEAAGFEDALYMATDREGMPWLSGGGCLITRDFLRMGLLFSRKGKGVMGRSVGSEKFINDTLSFKGPKYFEFSKDKFVYYANQTMKNGDWIGHSGYGGQFLMVNLKTNIVASFFSVLETESATNEEYKADMISMLDEIVTGNF